MVPVKSSTENVGLCPRKDSSPLANACAVNRLCGGPRRWSETMRFPPGSCRRHLGHARVDRLARLRVDAGRVAGGPAELRVGSARLTTVAADAFLPLRRPRGVCRDVDRGDTGFAG